MLRIIDHLVINSRNWTIKYGTSTFLGQNNEIYKLKYAL